MDEFIKILNRFRPQDSSSHTHGQMIVRGILLLTVVINTLFLIYFLSTGQYSTVIPAAIFSAAGTVFLVLYGKHDKNDKVLVQIMLSLSLLYALYLGISGGNSGYGIFWTVLYPLSALLIFRASRISIAYTAALFILLLLFFVISPQGSFFADYPTELMTRSLIIYLSVSILQIIYFKISEIEINRKEKELLDHRKQIQEQNQLISDLSFKLRSPLNHLVGTLNLKQDTPAEELIEEVELSVDNLVNLVNSIPSLSGVKGLRVAKRKSLFSLQKNIKKTIELFQTEDYKNLKLHLNISGQVPTKIYADITILKQILIGVIDFFYSNADKEQTDLELIVGKKSASDSGCEILFKVQSSKPAEIIEQKKSGNFINNIYDIDLPEVEYIDRQIKKMNGKLNLYSDASGTAFLFSLEVQTEDTDTKEKQTGTYNAGDQKKTPKDDQVPLQNANILLVEDDKVNQKIMVLTLKKYVKSTEVAQNGKEAIDKIGQKKYDLILMDIRMPYMDGYKTTQKIRETEAGTNLHVPIIAVTANALEGDKEKCLEAGMDDYMSKPLKTNDLLNKMKTLLNN